MNLHERIAEALNWTLKDVQSFSLPSLLPLVRPVDAKLAHEISSSIETAAHWTVPVQPRRRRW